MNIQRLKRAGIALHEHGYFDESMHCLELALSAAPNDPSLKWHRALVRLALGDYGAWADYEYRASQLPEHQVAPGRFSYWPSVDMLRGRNVIVHAEQGIGDEIMFASCIPDLCNVAKDVRLISDARLCNLFAQSVPCEGIFATGEIVPEERETLHLFAGSLPHAFRRSRASFPGDAYLIAEASHDFSHFKALNVGLCWRGGTVDTRGALRSVEATLLHRDLVRRVNDRAHFHCLQHDYRDGEPGYWGIAEWHELFTDFVSLAAYIKSLDLVVTVQCSIAHLAGALGVPTLVLLSAAPEWRYGSNGSFMPWYNSVTLLRQERLGDWSKPLAQARERINSLAGQKLKA